MASFKDTHGYTWEINITLADAMNVERADYSLLTGYDFHLSLLQADEETITKLTSNLGLIFAVIWTIVQKKAYEVLKLDPDISDQAAQQIWMARFDGDALVRGRAAFWEGLRDFFPNLRTLLSSLEKTQSRIESRLSAVISERMPMLDQAIDQELDQKIAELESQFLTKLKGNESGGG
jgi:hypothetical protein